LCETWLYRTADYERLPSAVTHFGGHWPEGQLVLELIRRNEDCHTVLLAEYFWTERPVGARPIRAFVRRARKSLPTDLQDAQLQYVFFSKAGFTLTAHQAMSGCICQWIGLLDLEEIIRRPLPKPRRIKLAF
jgi:hypothetical protein